MTPMDRREFLAAGGVALLGLGLAACGGDSNRPPGSGDTIDDLTRDKTNDLSVIAVQPNLARQNDRLSLALVAAGQGAGQPYEGGTARAWVAPDRNSPVIGPIDLQYHGEGFARGVYIGRVTFTTEGQWLIYVEAEPEGADRALSGGSTLLVGERPGQQGKEPQPAPGDQAVSTPTPTVDDHRGVEPYCTRLKPGTTEREPCTMHAISLDEALQNPKPAILVIGTPEFCTSAFCGPVIDHLMTVQSQLGEQIDFIHIELWRDDDPDTRARAILSPAAQAWRIEAEPVVYYIKPDGTIVDWAIGATTAAEITDNAGTFLLA